MASITSTSHAAEPTFHASGELTVAHNDNILATPEPAQGADDPAPVADASLQYAPGLVVLYTTPTARLQARYAHPITFFIRHPSADSSADVLALAGDLEPSPLDELKVGLELARHASNLSTLQSAGDTAIAAQRGGSAAMLGLAVGQSWRRALSESWYLLQEADGGLSKTLDDGPSYLASSVAVGPEWRHLDHALGFEPRIAYSAPLGEGDGGYQQAEQVSLAGRLRWQWVFVPPQWSFAAQGGAVTALAGADTAVAPVAAATLRFQERDYSVSLGYDRSYLPNLVVGQMYYSDAVVLSGEAPLVEAADLGLRTSTGLVFQRSIDDSRDLDTGQVNTFIVDVAFGWYSETLPQLELRYQHTNQWDAPTDQLLLPNFTRNVLSLSVRYLWPPPASTYPKGHSREPEEEPDPLAPPRRRSGPRRW